MDWALSLTASFVILNFLLALIFFIVKKNLIKKLILLTIATDSINLLAIFVGYRKWIDKQTSPEVPIFDNLYPNLNQVEELAKRAVDPLPQAFVLTSIVIELAILMVIVFFILKFYILTKTLNYDSIERRENE
ncbi:sodium:proton antiporter [Pseudothermotoga thermarum]|uniref:NADH-ubiquinone oxidoreductase chain 4L n=1 Tax=Pseudothermotoga thermarum DSM 5069 TaxID=688269 RepID=F7YU00_9THEM|nr:sodium:proton antiporter [Pseudothermotoga thermarum]AEH51582.1 NADH-ubiquinone oxidoreductase chain 4L [Pseudothermotoga thermarum DSM 5069]